MINQAEVIALAAEKSAIGIDGLPVSGKSTLAEALERELGAVCLYLDDFVIPEALWPRPLRPAYPFPYIRHDEFIRAAMALLVDRRCTFQPYDWSTNQLASPRTLEVNAHPVVIEGVSALDPALAPHYDLKLWVESDRLTTRAAAHARNGGQWASEWEHYFLPSVDDYLRTGPSDRADHRVAGRGAR